MNYYEDKTDPSSSSLHSSLLSVNFPHIIFVSVSAAHPPELAFCGFWVLGFGSFFLVTKVP